MYISNHLPLKVLNHKEFIEANTVEEYKWNYYVHESHCQQTANSCRDSKTKNKFALSDNTVQIPIVWLVNQEISKCPAQFICSFCWDCTLSSYFLSSIYLNKKTPYFWSSTSWKFKSLLSSMYFTFPIPKLFLGGFFSPIFVMMRSNTSEKVKSIQYDPDAYDIFDKLIFLTFWMKHLFWLVFIFMFSINRLSSISFVFQDSVCLWLFHVSHCQKCFDWHTATV